MSWATRAAGAASAANAVDASDAVRASDAAGSAGAVGAAPDPGKARVPGGTASDAAAGGAAGARPARLARLRAKMALLAQLALMRATGDSTAARAQGALRARLAPRAPFGCVCVLRRAAAPRRGKIRPAREAADSKTAAFTPAARWARRTAACSVQLRAAYSCVRLRRVGPDRLGTRGCRLQGGDRASDSAARQQQQVEADGRPRQTRSRLMGAWAHRQLRCGGQRDGWHRRRRIHSSTDGGRLATRLQPAPRALFGRGWSCCRMGGGGRRPLGARDSICHRA